MAIGAHELLLIVRAQNQASGLLNRVGRDIRRLQTMRDLDLQRGAQVNRLARLAIQQQQQMAKIQSVVAANGKARLQYEQAVARNQLQQMNIQNRIVNLEQRRTSVARAEAGLEVQRLRLMQQEMNIDRSLEKIDLRRQGIQNQIGRYNIQFMRGAQQSEKLRIGQMNAEAQVLERTVALRKAESSYMKAVRQGGPVRGSNADLARQAAQLRLQSAQATVATFPGQRDLLAASMAGVQANVKQAQASMQGLKAEEARLAESAGILAARHKVLETQMANVASRGTAVTASERELNAQLEITQRELGIVNTRWAENIRESEAAAAALKINISEQQALTAAIAETDAAMARQSAERMNTLIRGASHLGRVLATAGGLGVAAFAAMAVSAAHFNQEATRAATQTGSIGSGAGTVVANAKKIETAITGVMTSIPANQGNLTDALYNIYSSMNVTFGNGIKLLKLFGQVWVAGGMQGNINDVSDALITLANNWNINTNNMAAFQKLAASTLATVRFGRLTVEQYTTTMNQLAPAFHGAHQSIEQMNGALAFLTRLLPSQRVTAAGIARMVEQLQRFAAAPRPGFEGLAKAITTTTGNLKPLNQIINILIRSMPQLKTSGVALNNFFKTVSGAQGTVQARRALQGFIQQNQLYQQTLKNTSGDQKEFNRSLKAMEQSTGVRWAQFVNDMRVLGLELGQIVLPALLKVTTPLVNLVKWFNSLSGEQRKSYTQWAEYAAIFTLIGGVLLSVGAGLTLLIKSFGAMKETLGPLLGLVKTNKTAFEGLAGETGAANTKVVLLLGKIGLLIAAFKLLQGQTHDTAHTISILVDLIAAGTLLKSVKSIGSLTGEIGGLSGALKTSRGAMLGLRSATALEIVAVITLGDLLANLIRKIPGWDSVWKKFGETLYNVFHNSNKTMEVTDQNLQSIRDSLNKMSGSEKKEILPKLSIDHNVFQQDIKSIRGYIANLMRSTDSKTLPLPQATIEKGLARMFPELTPNAIKAFVTEAFNFYKRQVKASQTGQFTEALRVANFGAIPRATMGQTTAALTTREFEVGIRQAYRLQQVVQQAPNLNAWYAAYNRFNAFWKRLTQGMTKDQKKMADDALSAMSNFPQPTKSLSAIINLARHVEELHQAALTAKSDRRLWDEYWKALDRLNKLGTPDQISKANEFLQAQGDIAKYSTQQILLMAEAVQRLQEAYDKDPTNLRKSIDLQKAQAKLNVAGTSEQLAAVSPVVAAQATARAKQPIVPQSTITNLVEQERAVQKAAEAAPTNTAAWARYYALVDKIAELSRGHQEDIANSIADAIGGVSKLSLAQAVTMSRQLIKLQNIASKAPTIANWQRFFALQKKYAAEASDTIQSQADQIAQAQAQAADQAKQLRDQQRQQQQQDAQQALNDYVNQLNQKRDAEIEAARSQLQTANQTLTTLYQNAQQQYQSFLGTIFSGPFMQSAIMQNRQQFGFSARPGDLLRDMKMAVGQASRFSGDLDKLRKRGAPQAMISQIAELGPAALKQVETLLRMTPQQMKEYVATFKRGQDAADKYAKQQMNAQIKEWMKFGKSVAQAIITGVKSQTPALEASIGALVKKLFPGLTATSKEKTSGEGGGYRAGKVSSGGGGGGRRSGGGGGVLGLGAFGAPQYYDAHGHRIPDPTTQTLTPAQIDSGRSLQVVGNTTNHNVTYNIHPTQKGEGLESMLRRSHFYYRNRKTNL